MIACVVLATGGGCKFVELIATAARNTASTIHGRYGDSPYFAKTFVEPVAKGAHQAATQVMGPAPHNLVERVIENGPHKVLERVAERVNGRASEGVRGAVEHAQGRAAQTAAQVTRAAAAALAPWLESARQGERSITHGSLEEARMFLEAAARDAPRSMPAAADRRTLSSVHYHLARIHALSSQGLAQRGAQPAEIAPARAVQHVNQAFDHLHRALGLGWNHARHLLDDADLYCLHGDQRWALLVAPLSTSKVAR